MIRETTITGITLALIAGLFSSSGWAFEEMNPTMQEKLEQSRQQSDPYQSIPSQQGSDIYPSRLGADDKKKDSTVPPSSSDSGWTSKGKGDCRSQRGAYPGQNFGCGEGFSHPSVQGVWLNKQFQCYGWFPRSSCNSTGTKTPSTMENMKR